MPLEFEDQSEHLGQDPRSFSFPEQPKQFQPEPVHPKVPRFEPYDESLHESHVTLRWAEDKLKAAKAAHFLSFFKRIEDATHQFELQDYPQAALAIANAALQMGLDPSRWITLAQKSNKSVETGNDMRHFIPEVYELQAKAGDDVSSVLTAFADVHHLLDSRQELGLIKAFIAAGKPEMARKLQDKSYQKLVTDEETNDPNRTLRINLERLLWNVKVALAANNSKEATYYLEQAATALYLLPRNKVWAGETSLKTILELETELGEQSMPWETHLVPRDQPYVVLEAAKRTALAGRDPRPLLAPFFAEERETDLMPTFPAAVRSWSDDDRLALTEVYCMADLLQEAEDNTYMIHDPLYQARSQAFLAVAERKQEREQARKQLPIADSSSSSVSTALPIPANATEYQPVSVPEAPEDLSLEELSAAHLEAADIVNQTHQESEEIQKLQVDEL